MEGKENKNINWTPIVIAFLLILGFFGWRYSEIAKERIRVEKELQEKKLAQEKELVEEKIQDENRKEAEKTIAINDCERAAYQQYDQDWQFKCKLQSENQNKEREECVDGYKRQYPLEMSKDLCNERYPLLPKKDCSLPGLIAEKIERSLREAKEICYKKYK